MDYAAQKTFLAASKLWSVAIALALLAASALPLRYYSAPLAILGLYALILLATAASLAYTPDYLHLTAYPAKRVRWAVRVRYPLLATALALGLLFCHSRRSFIALLAAIAFLALTNFLVSRSSDHGASLLLSAMDYFVVFALLAFARLDPLIAAALFAALIHLFVVATKRRPYACAMLASIAVFSAIVTGFLLQVSGFVSATPTSVIFISARAVAALAVPTLISAFGTAFLVNRAIKRNQQNVAPVMANLEEFTGYTPETIRQKMATADAELAAKWKAAAIPEDDATRMAAWYQQNSELYLFALVSFNLDYKRIRYFLKIFPLAEGSCLDYGAGNGELLLELARRGHSATYYDVDGLTMKYARHRAAAENLNIQFFTTKPALSNAAHTAGFDTIFSLDVLEHLPDLPGELTFLSSLLSRTGKLIFNLPPGSTKSHPMHLTHNLDVRAFLLAKGLKEQKKSRISKDEMYIFTR